MAAEEHSFWSNVRGVRARTYARVVQQQRSKCRYRSAVEYRLRYPVGEEGEGSVDCPGGGHFTDIDDALAAARAFLHKQRMGEERAAQRKGMSHAEYFNGTWHSPSTPMYVVLSTLYLDNATPPEPCYEEILELDTSLDAASPAEYEAWCAQPLRAASTARETAPAP